MAGRLLGSTTEGWVWVLLSMVGMCTREAAVGGLARECLSRRVMRLDRALPTTGRLH